MRLRKSDKVIILGMAVLLTIAVTVTSLFFLLGGTVGTGKLSEVNTTRTFVKPPNMTAINNALDSVCVKNISGVCSLSSPKLIINVNAVLFDSNQKQFPSNTNINIPQQFSFIPTPKIPVYIDNKLLKTLPKLSLTDQQGHYLDLGNVQLGFTALVNNDAKITLVGSFDVYLDDQLRRSGQFTGQGTTTNKILQLSLLNKPAYTFTFSDEGKTWMNGTQHIFRVMIHDVTATVDDGTNSYSFKENNPSIAYILVMTLDSSKTTVIGYDNQATAIFKTDDTVQTCGRYPVLVGHSYGQTSEDVWSYEGASSSPSLTVYDNGYQIAHIDGTIVSNVASSLPSTSSNGKTFCSSVGNIPRDSDITIRSGTQSWITHTLITQQDLKIDCSGSLAPADPSHSTGDFINNGSCSVNFVLK